MPYRSATHDRDASNAAARNAWNKKAVGSQRASAPPGSAEYFAQIRAYRYGYETPFLPEVFGFSDLEGKRVLEIGIGNGIDAVEMMRGGARYTGLDITENHIRLTKKNIEIAGLNDKLENIIQDDLLSVSLNGRYDIIYSFGVLHHIAHEQSYIRRCQAILTQNGELRIGVYSKYSFFNGYLFATWLFRNKCRNAFDDWRSHVSEGTALGSPVVVKIRTRREVQSALEQAGFEVVRYRKRGFVQRYLPIVGGFLAPNGRALQAFGSVLGWYHCFICRPAR